MSKKRERGRIDIAGPLGLVRVDEVLLPIVSIALIDNGIEIRARADGPISAARGDTRLFSKNGAPLSDMLGSMPEMSIPAVKAGHTCTIAVPIVLMGLMPLPPDHPDYQEQETTWH